MARKPKVEECECEATGYVTERLRGRDGRFNKTIVTPLFRTTNCTLHNKKVVA